jgi:anti-anti-sigma regulatory factor
LSGEHQSTVIRVTSDDAGYRTVAVSGVLDSAAVASVCAATASANAHNERLVLDLLGVTAVEGDCLKQLARALRDLGVHLDVLSPPAGPENNADSGAY